MQLDDLRVSIYLDHVQVEKQELFCSPVIILLSREASTAKYSLLIVDLVAVRNKLM